jgi:hypothetical protein
MNEVGDGEGHGFLGGLEPGRSRTAGKSANIVDHLSPLQTACLIPRVLEKKKQVLHFVQDDSLEVG